jgi:hypothetical protein
MRIESVSLANHYQIFVYKKIAHSAVRYQSINPGLEVLDEPYSARSLSGVAIPARQAK